MMTIDPIHVCDLPLSREVLGLPNEAGSGNAVLLMAQNLSSQSRVFYQQMGCIYEGVYISSCSQEVLTVLEQMQLRWCSWPKNSFTLAVLEESQIGVLADRLIVSKLTHEADQGGSKQG